MITEGGGKTAVSLGQLRQLLTRHFDKSELRLLAFDLAVAYEDLPGSTRSGKAQALIAFLWRNSRLSDLTDRCRELRPRIFWSEIADGELPLLPTGFSSMRDGFSRYEAGLTNLQAQLGQSHPRYGDFLIYQHRLQENIAHARRYGDTETRRAERAEIVGRLNELALSETGTPFNKNDA